LGLSLFFRGERIQHPVIARLLGFSGFVDLFKTTSNLYVADGLIFKGLMGYSPIATNHYDIRQWRKPLKINPLLD